MYTNLFFKLIKLACDISVTVGVCSIQFDIKTKTFYASEKYKKKVRLVFCLANANMLFWVFRTLEIWFFKGGNSNEHFHICYAYTFSSVMGCGSIIFFIWARDDLCILMTQIIRYFQNFQVEWMPEYNPEKAWQSRVMDGLWILLIAFFGGAPFSTVLHYLLFPETPIYLVTILPEKWREYIWIYLICTVPVTWFGFVTWTAFQSCLTFASLYFFSVLPFISNEFRASTDPGFKYITKESLRTAENLPHEYTCMQLLHNQGMYIAGYLLFGFHGAFSQFILVCNFSVILYWDLLKPFTKLLLFGWAATVQVIWVIVLEIGGRFNESSKKTIKSWKHLPYNSKLNKKILSKFKKTCKPMKLGAEGVFAIKRLSVLKFLRAIVKGTFRAVLLGQKQT